MKFDPNPRNRGYRVDREKQDRTQTVSELPARPVDGETVILRHGENRQLCVYSRDGEWICLDEGVGPPGPPGKPGPAGGGASVTSGVFTPNPRKILYHVRQGDQWREAPGTGNSEISMDTNPTPYQGNLPFNAGTWTRIGNTVFFTIRCLFTANVDLSQAMVYFDPPLGTTIQNCDAVATPQNAAQNWFAVYCDQGDRNARIENGNPVFGTENNAIFVNALEDGRTGTRFTNKISVIGKYEIAPGDPDADEACISLTVLNDPNGDQQLRAIALPADYTDYTDVYIATLVGPELRSNTLKIDALVDGRRYRIGGPSDVTWNSLTRTLTLTGDGGNGNLRHVVLTGCKAEAGGGQNGWSPRLAVIARNREEVLQIQDWFGGEGTRPPIGQYIGRTGFVDAIADAVNIKGRDGRDGMGNIHFSHGFFTPVIPLIIYKIHDDDNGWFHTSPFSELDITARSGRWVRWGDIVEFYLCFTVDASETRYPNGFDQLRAYVNLPEGLTGGGGHGLGTPISPLNRSWYPIAVGLGDQTTRVNHGQAPTEGSENNSIRLVFLDPTGNGNYFKGLMSAHGFYTVIT